MGRLSSIAVISCVLLSIALEGRFRAAARQRAGRGEGGFHLAEERRNRAESRGGEIRLEGMTIAPAGTQADNSGHHHLLVDTDLGDLNLSAPLPATDKILHFGKGQTETTLTLPPGKHTLELLFADYQHLSFDPPLHSKKITITVQ